VVFKNIAHSLEPGSKLCTTFLDIAKHGVKNDIIKINNQNPTGL